MCTCKHTTNRRAIIASLISLALLRFFALPRYGHMLSCGHTDQENHDNYGIAPHGEDDMDETYYQEPIDSITDEEGRFSHLQENDYIPQDVTIDTFAQKDETLTRSSVTPYLLRYAQINNIPQQDNTSCTFPDIGSETESMQEAIRLTCEYGLMRGSQGEFLPEQPLKKYELLTILIRSQFGSVEETTQPRYQSYIQKAQNENIIKDDIQTTNREEGVTLTDLGKRLNQSNQ